MPQDERVAETLSWIQPRMLHEEFVLESEGTAVGSLKFRSGWGTLATGTLGHDSWTFKRQGFLRTRVTVRAAATDQDLATFQPETWSGGGTLAVGTRHQFRVVINFWQTRFALVRPDNHTLLRYRPKGVLRQEADMDICDGAKEIQELPWLMLFGWYLVVLLQRDAAAAAAAV